MRKNLNLENGQTSTVKKIRRKSVTPQSQNRKCTDFRDRKASTNTIKSLSSKRSSIH